VSNSGVLYLRGTGTGFASHQYQRTGARFCDKEVVEGMEVISQCIMRRYGLKIRWGL
jgi:hypothetical protein